MARSEWQELLGHSGVHNSSLAEVVREVESSTSPVLASIGRLSGFDSGGANSSTTVQQSSSNEMVQQMSSLVSQITGLNSTEQSAITAIQGNTQAVTQNTSSKGSGSSAARQAGGVAESLFGGALSLSPILSGIMSLFGGSSSAPATPMMPFMLPPAVQYQAGSAGSPGSPVSPVNYAEGGQPRVGTPSTPQITVQVNAMDSQSFLDHSDEIASAVKAALLNSNSLGDVISEL